MCGACGLLLGMIAANCFACAEAVRCSRRSVAGNLETASKKRGGSRSTRKPWAEVEDGQLMASQL